MKTLLIITADTNDADYIRTVEFIEEDNVKRLEEIIPKFEAKVRELKKKSPHVHNWQTSENSQDSDPWKTYKDVLTENEINFLDKYVPYGDHGVHTIESIKLYEVADEQTLYFD